MMQNTIIYKIIIYSIVIIFSLIVSWILFQKTLKTKLNRSVFVNLLFYLVIKVR
jgi:prolipoprotein diacylglyceryltransferase